MNYYFSGLKKYAVFNGRAHRKEFWMFFLFNMMFSIVFSIISDNKLIYSLYSTAVLIPNIAVCVRRMHDVGKSGWFILIPIYGFILSCTKGDSGENKYGAEPKQEMQSLEQNKKYFGIFNKRVLLILTLIIIEFIMINNLSSVTFYKDIQYFIDLGPLSKDLNQFWIRISILLSFIISLIGIVGIIGLLKRKTWGWFFSMIFFGYYGCLFVYETMSYIDILYPAYPAFLVLSKTLENILSRYSLLKILCISLSLTLLNHNSTLELFDLKSKSKKKLIIFIFICSSLLVAVHKISYLRIWK